MIRQIGGYLHVYFCPLATLDTYVVIFANRSGPAATLSREGMTHGHLPDHINLGHVSLFPGGGLPVCFFHCRDPWDKKPK